MVLMSTDVASLRSEDYSTAFAGLVALDDGMVAEALRLDKTFIERIASLTLLKQGSSSGLFELYLGSTPIAKLSVHGEPMNGKYIDMEIDEEMLRSLVLIHISQERPLNKIAEILRTVSREYLELVERYGPTSAT